MKVTDAPIDSLIPYEFNNRIHQETQVNRIANSIAEFGFNQPIVVDENNIVLVGHGRLLAAQKLGLKTAPVLKLTDLSETQKKAYRILDNKLQNDSTWDFDNLGLELDFLEDNDFKLEPWGLDELRIGEDEEPEVTEDDGGGELPDETFLKRGDLIELGRHRVLCGDSTSAEDVAELMGEHLAKIVYTDPPYGVNYDGGATSARAKLANDHNSDIYAAVLPRIVECSDKRAPLYLWHSHSASYDVLAALKSAGYEVRSQIIWNKDLAQFGALSAQYKQKHEPCFYAYKRGDSPFWYGPTNEITVWDVNRASKNEFHPTQNPIELAARALKNSSQKNDLVLDVFLGSGSTLIACEQLNRTCYGMELEPKYCQVILERYQKYCAEHNKSFDCKINGEPYIPLESAAL